MTSHDTVARPAFPAAASTPDAVPTLHLETTVNDVLRLLPYAGAVFDAFGVDACCGGGDTLVEAARAAHLDPAVLLEALASTVHPSFDAAATIATDGR